MKFSRGGWTRDAIYIETSRIRERFGITKRENGNGEKEQSRMDKKPMAKETVRDERGRK